MQASLEAEVKAKQEALRMKKKIEADINELEMTLDHANKANAEEQKQIKRYASTLMEHETMLQEEARARTEIQDQAGIAERKGEGFFFVISLQSWGHFWYFIIFSIIKKWFSAFFIKLIWLGVSFLNRTGAEIGY